MGGVYATTCYDHIIEDRNIDYVLLGYAENRLDKFLQKLCEKSSMDNFAGAVYRENGSVKINPVDSYIGDVREMAKPDYSKIDLSPYVEHGSDFRHLQKGNFLLLHHMAVPIIVYFVQPEPLVEER